MVEIISKSDGPRREDAAARKYLRDNAATIKKIADQLGGGAVRARPGVEPMRPQASGRKYAARKTPDADTRPYVQISLNGRVIVVDFNSGRQLHFIGELRGGGASRRFALATRANGFFAPLDDQRVDRLRDLDGLAAADDAARERLVATIEERLEIARLDDSGG